LTFKHWSIRAPALSDKSWRRKRFMSKFKVGDLVVAMQFDGPTGRYLVPNKVYRVAIIGEINSAEGHLLTLDGLYNNGEPVRAYDRRFELYISSKMDDAASEYEEAMEFDRLVNG